MSVPSVLSVPMGHKALKSLDNHGDDAGTLTEVGDDDFARPCASDQTAGTEGPKTWGRCGDACGDDGKRKLFGLRH